MTLSAYEHDQQSGFNSACWVQPLLVPYYEPQLLERVVSRATALLTVTGLKEW